MSKNKHRGRAREPSSYVAPHDLAIRRANWAMATDPACVEAFQRRKAAKEELGFTSREEIPRARAAFTAADAEWKRVTLGVFRRVMAEFAEASGDQAAA